MYTSPFEAGNILKEGTGVILKSQKHQKEYQIEYSREIKGSPVIKFAGIDSINDALKLVGYSICVEGIELPEPPENDQNAHPQGTISFTVIDIRGEVWGTVEDIDDSSMNTLLEVRAPNGEGGSESEIRYVPFADGIVTKIDHQNKTITIDPPEGLKELNRK